MFPRLQHMIASPTYDIILGHDEQDKFYSMKGKKLTLVIKLGKKKKLLNGTFTRQWSYDSSECPPYVHTIEFIPNNPEKARKLLSHERV
jgi:hypothetical protein